MPDKNIDPVKTGEFIAKLRTNLGLTQEQLGEKLFISRKSVSKWETGRCCPSIDMIKRLSVVLDVSLEELLAGEFLEEHDQVETVMEVRETYPSKTRILHNKWFISVSVLCIIVLFIVTIFFVSNLSADKVYLINYEDENFTITNGIIALSKKGSYINLGNFYSDLDDNSTSSYGLELYYKYPDGKEVKFAQFNGSNTFDLGKDDYNRIKKIIKSDVKNWYIKVILFSEDRVYDLKLNITEKPKNEKVEENLLNDVDAKYNVDEFDSIDLSFLFEMDKDTLAKKYNNKKIRVLSIDYKISFNANEYSLYFESNNYDIHISLPMRRISIFDENVITIIIGDDNIVNSEDATTEILSLLSALVSELSKTSK